MAGQLGLQPPFRTPPTFRNALQARRTKRELLFGYIRIPQSTEYAEPGMGFLCAQKWRPHHTALWLDLKDVLA
ncbi:MAG: hypothetical protein EA370_16325, partial [Wenzhouxiangella sp.]